MKPHIDPEYIELSRKMSAEAIKQNKKQRRTEWWQNNCLSVAALILSLISIVISLTK